MKRAATLIATLMAMSVLAACAGTSSDQADADLSKMDAEMEKVAVDIEQRANAAAAEVEREAAAELARIEQEARAAARTVAEPADKGEAAPAR